MKKLFAIIIVVSLMAFVPSLAMATNETVCTTSYGGGTVCGAKTHESVEAGLAENLGLLGFASLGASALFQKLAKNTKKLVTNA